MKVTLMRRAAVFSYLRESRPQTDSYHEILGTEGIQACNCIMSCKPNSLKVGSMHDFLCQESPPFNGRSALTHIFNGKEFLFVISVLNLNSF